MKKFNYDRLWSKIDVRSENECWVWQGAKTTAGYGVIRINYILKYAHRLTWMLHYKSDIPKKGQICHTCDNPPCCNPAHLFLGSQADNMKDAANKGRIKEKVHRGITHHTTHLKEKDIRKIRHLGQTDIPHQEIGNYFGISRMSVNDIIHKRTWQHIDPEYKPPKSKSKGVTHPFAKLTEDNVREIRQLSNEGYSPRAIATIFGVSRGTIEPILKGETWKHVT